MIHFLSLRLSAAIRIFAFIFIPGFSFAQPADEPNFTKTTLLNNQLHNPWDLAWGPDSLLWVTEAHSYKIFKIDPTANGGAGSETLVTDLSGKRLFTATQNPWPQGGLMGMAFHPDFANKPFIYVAYVFQFVGSNRPGYPGVYFKTRIERYTYDTTQVNPFTSPVTIIELTGSTDHNGGRMTIGSPPGDTGKFLFYTIGETGAGQGQNPTRPEYTQNKDSLLGKVLRFNLEPDEDVDSADQWIPNDNPYNLADIETNPKTAVWTYGHRNPQGIVFGTDALGDTLLFNSEHGPQSDDEINLIKKGGNYGFPYVIGYADGNYNGYSMGPYTPGPDGSSTSEQAWHDSLNTIEPFSTLNSTVDPPNLSFTSDGATRPTVAPSGMDFYNSTHATNIPGWENSILVATMKNSNRNPSMMRIKLNDDGTAGQVYDYFRQGTRYRDVLVSPDGQTIYLIQDGVTASLFAFHYVSPTVSFAINDTTLCAADSLNITYQTTGTYAGGNTFSVELSDKEGDFSNPVVIGTKTTTTADTIACSLPRHLETGEEYRIRIKSSDPVMISDTSNAVLHFKNRPDIGIDTSSSILCGDETVNIASFYDTHDLTALWGTPDPTAAPAGVYNLIVWNAEGCSDTAVITIAQKIAKWTGAVSSDWHDKDNWSSGQVPDEDTHVIIPPGTINSCIISTADASAASVQAKSGVTVQIINNRQLFIKANCAELPADQ